MSHLQDTALIADFELLFFVWKINKKMAQKSSFVTRVLERQAERRGMMVVPKGDAQALLDAIRGGANGVDFGVVVNHDSSLRFTAVFAAIKILAENIASLPKTVKQKTDKGYIDDPSHPASWLIGSRPNEYTDVFTFWFSIIATLEGYGNAYAIIKRDLKGQLVSLHQVHPSNVTIKFAEGKKFYVVNNPEGAFEFLNGTYLDYEMLHFMIYTRNGIEGIDPISYNAAAIARGIATQKFSSEFYRKGGNIKGVLETENALGDAQYTAFLKHYQQSSQNFETPLLEYGVKYKEVGISPVAAQHIQTETMAIEDIARIFSIPPHLLADLEHATFSNIEQQNIFFAKYSLRPLCKRIEVQLEAKLFDSSERGKYSVKFDLKGMMRGDDASRSKYYKDAVEGGWMTPNEVRDQEEMQRLDGLDKPRRPLNYVEVGEETNN